MVRHALMVTTSLCLLSACGQSDGAQGNAADQAAATAKNYVTTAVEPGFISVDARLSGLSGSGLYRSSVSPDGSLVSFLKAGEDSDGKLDLWAFDLSDGTEKRLVGTKDLLSEPEVLSEEERNRRERARVYGSGIISYDWVDDNRIMFPLGGDVHLYDLEAGAARQVTATDGFETDPKVSPLGGHVAYVRDNELYSTSLESGDEIKLTKDSSDVVRNATASFVVQEELDRNTGYWWSPDDSHIAYTQIDESPVAIETRIDFGKDGISQIAQRYPFAGTDNATVKLGVIPRAGGKTIWADIGSNPDIYLTRVFWSPDGSKLFAGILSRDHKTHSFYQINPKTGASNIAFSETSPTWINVGSDQHMLGNGNFLWTSETSGRRQVYEINSGESPRQITPDSVLVKRVNCVDEAGGRLYFSGWDTTPIEQHIFAIDMDGQNLTRLSTQAGWNSASFAENCASYIGFFQDENTPSQSRAFSNSGEPLTWLSENKLDDTHPYGPYMANHIKPEYGQIKADDGTLLDYVLYKPVDLKPGEKRPSITYVYGGPGVQIVSKTWGRGLFPRMLAHHGYVVFTLDNRGATNRGKDFEDHLYRAMGQIEVQDQSTGAEWLKTQDFIDPDRMGVYGWSYGGYMTLHMLAQTDHYKSGVSGAPVTDWALYDTAYTERYLGNPKPDGTNYTSGSYEQSSVFTYLDGLTEDLLLIHGMADDNVVFRHSVMLMDEMQNKGAQNMRVMTYPGEKHGFRRGTNAKHRDQMIVNFFAETLGE